MPVFRLAGDPTLQLGRRWGRVSERRPAGGCRPKRIREQPFKGADHRKRDCHALRRRRILAEAAQPIGKEADNLEERDTIGDEDAAIEYNLSPDDRAKLIAIVKAARKEFVVRQLSAAAKVSHHRINDVIRGRGTSDRLLLTLSEAASALMRRDEEKRKKEKGALENLGRLVSIHGRNVVARELGVDPSNLSKMLAGRRRLNARMLAKLESYLSAQGKDQRADRPWL